MNTFKVGDKVVITDNNDFFSGHSMRDRIVGMQGVVEHVIKDYCYVKFNYDNDSYGWHISFDQMKLDEPA